MREGEARDGVEEWGGVVWCGVRFRRARMYGGTRTYSERVMRVGASLKADPSCMTGAGRSWAPGF